MSTEAGFARYRGREAAWRLEVREHEGGWRGSVSWLDDDEVMAVCDAPEPADCVAGVAAALAGVAARLDLASRIRRVAGSDDPSRE